MFTDEDLAPTRTTRQTFDALHDGVREVAPGDELLVDVSAYLHLEGDERLPLEAEAFAEWPLVWCRVTGLAPGSASVYPYKVEIPERGTGQYSASQVVAWRRPVEQHRLNAELREIHLRAEVVPGSVWRDDVGGKYLVDRVEGAWVHTKDPRAPKKTRALNQTPLLWFARGWTRID